MSTTTAASDLPAAGQAIVGVTASGKTAIAIAIAESLGAEILCADAMTVYRGMDIGTAKPTDTQRSAVRHHLLDLTEPGDPMTLGRFLAAADAARAAIAPRTALVVGGSGLYLRALLDGFVPPPTDPEVRAAIEQLAPDQALRRLREQDPDAFDFIDPANRRRVVRALEVIELTGERFSAFRNADTERPPARIVGLAVSDAVLDVRIEHRVDAMLEVGWLEEVATLAGAGARAAVEATYAIGYRELFAVLDGGLAIADARDAIIRATRKLARRQMTWFRADPRIHWLDADDLDGAVESARAYLATPDPIEQRRASS